jgi:membrane-bound ClpP family serine protease
MDWDEILGLGAFVIFSALVIAQQLGVFDRVDPHSTEEVADQRKAQGLDEKPDGPPVGSVGLVVTMLRPIGKIRIDGQIWEAKSVGTTIAPLSTVEVVDYSGKTPVVREIQESSDS